MHRNRMALAVAMAFAFCTPPAFVQAAGSIASTKTLGIVTVTGGQPTSQPAQIPTTMEGSTRALSNQQERFGGAGHRQRQQRPVLEFPPLSAAQLCGGTQIRPLKETP